MAKEIPGVRWRNWSREQVCHPWEIARPHTREGLTRTIVDANAAGQIFLLNKADWTLRVIER